MLLDKSITKKGINERKQLPLTFHNLLQMKSTAIMC